MKCNSCNGFKILAWIFYSALILEYKRINETNLFRLLIHQQVVKDSIIGCNLKIVNGVICCFADCYFSLKVWNAQNAGATTVLVFDDREEPLITMDSPKEDTSVAKYLQNITIPSALI